RILGGSGRADGDNHVFSEQRILSDEPVCSLESCLVLGCAELFVQLLQILLANAGGCSFSGSVLQLGAGVFIGLASKRSQGGFKLGDLFGILCRSASTFLQRVCHFSSHTRDNAYLVRYRFPVDNHTSGLV